MLGKRNKESGLEMATLAEKIKKMPRGIYSFWAGPNSPAMEARERFGMRDWPKLCFRKINLSIL